MRRNERILQTNRALRLAKRRQGRARQELLDEAVELNISVARSIDISSTTRASPPTTSTRWPTWLVKAVNGFDPEKGDEFLAYAVPRSPVRSTGTSGTLLNVRPPRRIQDLQAEIPPAVEQLSQLLGGPPRAADIAEHLGRSEDEIVEALACGGCFTPSPSTTASRGDGYQVSDRLGEDDRGFARAEAVPPCPGPARG